MKRRIAVDSVVLRVNHQTDEYGPPIELIEGDGLSAASCHFYRVDIYDHDGAVVASIVYRPTRSREFECWIETECPVVGHSEPSAMLTGQSST